MNHTQTMLTYTELECTGPYPLQTISELRIERKLNDHARLKISGWLDEEQRDHYIEQDQDNEPVIIRTKTENGQPERILFHGLLVHAETRMVRGIYYVELEAVSHTIQLDITPVTRSYQDTLMPYGNLIKQIIQKHNQADVIDNITDSTILHEFTLQYRETDWAFLKRMASRFGTVLIPEISLNGPKFWFGMPEGQYVEMKHPVYRTRRSFDPKRTAEFSYMMESETLARPGDLTNWNGEQWMVAEVTSELRKGLLLHEYELVHEQGIQQTEILCPHLTGASFEGRVIEAKSGRIRIHLTVDEKQDQDKAWWFPYASSYTAEGHSGWYVMPERGDTVSVRFPTEQEADGYAASSIRQGRSSSPKLTDPATKYWGTPHGKAIKLSASELKVTAKSEQVHISMNGSGIQVVSEHELSLSAGKTLSLHADGELNIQAAEAIYFKAGSSSLVLDGETDIRSAKVQLEGTVKRSVFVADLAPIWEPPLMSMKAYAEAQAAKSAANSSTGGSSNSSVTSKDGGAVKSAVNTPNSPKASLLDGVLGLAQKVCDVAASIPVLGAIPKAASQKIASIRSEVASSGPSSIVKYAAAGLSMIASVPSHGWGVVLGKTAKVAAQTLHAHAEEQRARERHATMDFLGKVWTSARGYGEVQSIHDFINYVKGVNQASVQAYSDIPSDIRERWYQRNVDQQFEKALDAYYNNQDLSTDIVALMEHQRQTDNHFRYSDRALMSSKYRDDMKGYTTEQKKYLIDFLNSIDEYRKEYGPYRESPFMKDLDETERIVLNEIKNSAYESVEATWERIRNFPNLDIRQMVADNFQAKQDVADNIVNVITDPDAAYEKTINRSKQENAHLLVDTAFAFIVGMKGKKHSKDDGASPGGSHKKEDHSSEGTGKPKWWHPGYVDNLTDSQILLGVKQSPKGLSTLGSSTRTEAMNAGKAWVGEGAKDIIDKTTGEIIGFSSADGMRAFRIQFKPGENMVRANFQENIMIRTERNYNDYNKTWAPKQIRNVHIDILD
ncbi:contractile injection system protein, VgrG/Pvc8 family [Paenibacillus sp. A3M_27_13]|uniref:phage baseplate assembly protein V n=1 Tax=Paenibacillus sp. A3M_27_13 TaxID=2962029 RepID=UPI0020B7A461|nr:contractile injection system protein, VgrG/Pvc8 family [Paenibacillus sp. A3M_27_13]MCP3746557.1 contractile injection system protein, VgrG/Pvc8 family [Paenibacillus sp. A3M_27_13]